MALKLFTMSRMAAGSLLAGAMLLTAMPAAAQYRDGRNDRHYGGERQAVSQCVRAVERRGRGLDVTRITDLRRQRDGYRVQGRVEVDRRGWRDDRRYGNRRHADRGSFTCTVRHGRIDRLNVRGV